MYLCYGASADRCQEQAGSLTYTTLFAVVPMLTVFLVIISSIKALEPARQQLQQLIYSNFLPKSTIAFDKAIHAFTEKSSNLTIIGVLFLFITTVLMLTSIENVLTVFGALKKHVQVCWFYALLDHYFIRPNCACSAFVLSSTVASMNILSNNFAGYQLMDLSSYG